jgi:hypothetical protein
MSDNGFELQANGLMILKDTQAVLTYAFDWVDWLQSGDSISEVEYSVQARLNDPSPIMIESFGIAGTQTFVELSGGQVNKSYTITAKVTTSIGLIDRRNFSVRVENRSA